jgi:molybdenum cofactor guanylyltransferase
MPAASAFDIADVSAAILAGGEGVRVAGQDKGLLELAGERLIARVSRIVRTQASTVLICASRHAETYAAFGTVVADAIGGFRGPLAGIAGALAVSTTPWLLTVPVDCPDPPADLAARLLAAAITAGTSLAVAHDGARAQPLFAVYRRALAESSSDALVRDMPVWRWQRDCAATVVDFSDRAAHFANLNTPDEFRDWEQRQHG